MSSSILFHDTMLSAVLLVALVSHANAAPPTPPNAATSSVTSSAPSSSTLSSTSSLSSSTSTSTSSSTSSSSSSSLSSSSSSSTSTTSSSLSSSLSSSSSSSSPSASSTASSSSKHGIATGTLVGIIIGGVVLLSLIWMISTTYFSRARRHRKRPRGSMFLAPSLGSTGEMAQMNMEPFVSSAASVSAKSSYQPVSRVDTPDTGSLSRLPVLPPVTSVSPLPSRSQTVSSQRRTSIASTSESSLHEPLHNPYEASPLETGVLVPGRRPTLPSTASSQDLTFTSSRRSTLVVI